MLRNPRVTSAPLVSWVGAFLLLVVSMAACRHSPLASRDSATGARQMRLGNPIPGARVAAGYEERGPLSGVRKHDGIDLAAPRGTLVQAAAAGTVELSTSQQGYGNLVVIDHGADFKTYYAHLDSIVVEEGQLVSSAQPIGTVGATGFATSFHLHFEVRYQEAPTNPHPFVAEWEAGR